MPQNAFWGSKSVKQPKNTKKLKSRKSDLVKGKFSSIAMFYDFRQKLCLSVCIINDVDFCDFVKKLLVLLKIG